MEKKRISWIDICRGLGIIFVIYAHELDRNSIRFIFYAFHMPLFFFLTGIVHHHKKNEQFIAFLKKNSIRILVPYFLFALLTYSWWLLTQNNGPFNPTAFLTHMSGILYGSGAADGLFFNTILWFLPCLFAAKVILELLTRISNKVTFLLPSLGILATTGYAFSILYPKTKLPFHIETALTAVVFMGFGYLMYISKDSIFAFIERHKWHVVFASVIVLVVSASLNYSLTGLQNDMRLNRLNNVFLFYLSSLSGVIASVSLSMIISRNTILEYLGKISLFLFVFHPLVFYYLDKVSIYLIDGSGLNRFKNIVLAPTYTIISLLVISGITLVYQFLQTRKQHISVAHNQRIP